MTEGALVLEGGSLRCLFTSGVLDVLVEQGIELSYVNGVSAGSMCGMNYISKQVGRTLKINTQYVHDKRYLSFRNMYKNRAIFNFDFLFGELSNELLPFDYETFYKSEQRYVAVATRCKTGKPEYFEKGVCTELIPAIQASSSMPVLSRMISVEGKKYLDGGISMPIAYQKALDEGYEKVVLVLTREHGYRKKEPGRWMKRGYDRYFAPLPQLRAALEEIPERYNRMQEEIDRLEEEGKIFVIRPRNKVTVSRMEQDVKKLEALYLEGRALMEETLPGLRGYLGI
ncbi:patatin family protein [Clostridium sp. MCC353]|uniref:patatin-like phospholipase family protein n=1 Tax=Clostridium sp. MCC353 TaxID=2592646 RepID=UPI001C01ACD6|nr:patatin family protein [Clostridium sp. MCC353]MBT9779324.1 patatin family protein [Clostridium sp. MCC353]